MRLVLLLGVALLCAACGATPPQSAAPASTAAPTATAVAATVAPTAATQTVQQITLAMPYIPNVQFAHIYVADAKGYYTEAGLDVTLDYNFETDVVQRVAGGSGQFGLASGDSVLLARGQGLPVVTVATNSQQFPIVFFSKAEENIRTPADLRGKSIGIPGRFGASYVGLLALLYANDIEERDLNIQEIGFAQVAAVSEGKVQVGSGYGNNEPIQLAQQGIELNVIAVSDFFPLASDGIIASQDLIAQQPETVRGFVQATMRGMQDVISDPDAAFQTSLEYIPELQSADAVTQQLQREVLAATLVYWQSDLTAQEGLGHTDRASWEATATFLRDSGLLQSDVNLDEAFTNEFLR